MAGRLFRFSILAAIVFASCCARADAPSIDRLAHSSQWLRLLHYKRSFPFYQLRSQVDGPQFFFSPNGETDPKAELLATVEAFSEDEKTGKKIGMLKQHPQCAFPERYRFLKSELGLKTKDVPCPKLDEYLAKFNAKSTTLVFSSAYPNNPGSMFGHTFLRINAKAPKTQGAGPTQEKLDLLDYGLSYAAAVGPNDNPAAFIWWGLTGGYQGRFSMLPYFVKVNEYSNSESRDLWEYELSLTEAQTQTLLRHAWEIETNSYFEYYFFDENCAYQLLTLLEVARPDWDFSNFYLFTTPAETVKRVVETPGAVVAVKFRPSLRKRMLRKFEALSASEKIEFFKVARAEMPAENASSAAALETTAAYLEYNKQKEDGVATARNKKLLGEVLVRRSELGTVTGNAGPAKPDDESSRPERGHLPFRLGVAGGYQDGVGDPTRNPSSWFQELGFKFAFHDLMNNDQGYTPFSQIDFPSITLRYVYDDRVFTVEEISALAITSLFPMHFLEHSLSWRFAMNYYSPKDYGCAYCHLVHAEGGVGAALQPFSERYIAYALLLANIEAGESLRTGYRFGPKAVVAAIANPVQPYKLRLAANVVTDLAQSDRQKLFYEFELEQSLSVAQNWELRAALSMIVHPQHLSDNYRSAKLTLNYYY